MRQRLLQSFAGIAAAALLIVGGLVPRVSAQSADVPVLTQPVNDLANVIDASSAAAMDQMIRALQTATGDSVIVASVKTFAPYGSIEEFAVKLYERAGIGAKGKDNGVLILVAVDDKRARIEVGYGLEGFLTDGFSGDVIRTTMLPAFRRGAYGAGLLDATTAVIERIARERNITLTGMPAPAPERAARNRVKSGGSIVKLIFFVVILLFILGRSGGKSGGTRGGGGAGLLGFILGQMLAGGGRRGGGWSGGGFGGGGFGGGLGGGGFGGFGGGRSGGGGASGGW